MNLKPEYPWEMNSKFTCCVQSPKKLDHNCLLYLNIYIVEALVRYEGRDAPVLGAVQTLSQAYRNYLHPHQTRMATCDKSGQGRSRKRGEAAGGKFQGEERALGWRGERSKCSCNFPRKIENVVVYPLKGMTLHRVCSYGIFEIVGDLKFIRNIPVQAFLLPEVHCHGLQLSLGSSDFSARSACRVYNGVLHFPFPSPAPHLHLEMLWKAAPAAAHNGAASPRRFLAGQRLLRSRNRIPGHQTS